MSVKSQPNGHSVSLQAGTACAVSGATTLRAGSWCEWFSVGQTNQAFGPSGTPAAGTALSNLTPGVNIFSMQHNVNVGNCNFANRMLMVERVH